MKCQGKFKFKGLEHRDGGEFINSQGKKIDYKASYALKVDEMDDNGSIYERQFKIAFDSVLIPTLSTLKPYADIVLEFEINIYNNSVRIIPIGVKPIDNNK